MPQKVCDEPATNWHQFHAQFSENYFKQKNVPHFSTKSFAEVLDEAFEKKKPLGSELTVVYKCHFYSYQPNQLNVFYLDACKTKKKLLFYSTKTSETFTMFFVSKYCFTLYQSAQNLIYLNFTFSFNLFIDIFFYLLY